MEEYGISFEGMSRKKRSHIFRRPPPDYGAANECHDVSSLSSIPPQHEESKASSDENTRFGSTSMRKEVNINQLVTSFPAASRSEGERLSIRSRKEGVRLDGLYANNENKRSSEGLFAPGNWKSLNDGKTKSGVAAAPHLSHDGTGNENKVIKVTLKVGGVTLTIDTNSGDKFVRSSEASAPRQKPTAEVGSEDDHYRWSKRLGLQGIRWKYFSTVGFTLWKESSSTGSMPDKNHTVKQGEHSDPVRKSNRAPKKVVTFDDEDEDEEIRYLEKLKNIKHCSGYKDDEEESTRKHRRLSAVSGIEKAADELRRQSNCIRIIDGPNGTTVTFPNEMGLPSIFSSKPFRYPSPREKCAGPSCTNPYKYRDSKTNLPLCSLQCYKRVQANIQSDSARISDINTHQFQEQTNAAMELKA
ncbi:hypothetical protein AKJ16_DCAP18279 [Drosera capensis]